RMAAAAAADEDPELILYRSKTALERTHHARRDAGGVPVHSHHRAERLEPERMREAAEKLVAAVMMDNRLGNQPAETRHALGEPWGDMPAMEWQVGASRAAAVVQSRHAAMLGDARPDARGKKAWTSAGVRRVEDDVFGRQIARDHRRGSRPVAELDRDLIRIGFHRAPRGHDGVLGDHDA